MPHRFVEKLCKLPALSGAAALALALLALAPAVQARNDKLLLPVKPMLNQLGKRDLLGQGISFHFGAEVPAGYEVMDSRVEVQGKADPSSHKGARFALPDDVVCYAAFRQALLELVQKARDIGGTALVGIVSNYKRVEMDSPDTYECHVGYTRAVVELKAQVAKKALQAPSVKNTVVPVDDPAAAVHERRVPTATRYASANDVEAVPLAADGKARYRHYLTLPSPKAFVIYLDGNWRFYSRDPAAMTKALDYCARQGKPCWLYAVDDAVVWSEDVAQRIGKSSQLATP